MPSNDCAQVLDLFLQMSATKMELKNSSILSQIDSDPNWCCSVAFKGKYEIFRGTQIFRENDDPTEPFTCKPNTGSLVSISVPPYPCESAACTMEQLDLASDRRWTFLGSLDNLEELEEFSCASFSCSGAFPKFPHSQKLRTLLMGDGRNWKGL